MAQLQPAAVLRQPALCFALSAPRLETCLGRMAVAIWVIQTTVRTRYMLHERTARNPRMPGVLGTFHGTLRAFGAPVLQLPVLACRGLLHAQQRCCAADC